MKEEESLELEAQEQLNEVPPSSIPAPEHIREQWIQDPATRIALITGFVSVLITVLNALLN